MRLFPRQSGLSLDSTRPGSRGRSVFCRAWLPVDRKPAEATCRGGARRAGGSRSAALMGSVGRRRCAGRGRRPRRSPRRTARLGSPPLRLGILGDAEVVFHRDRLIPVRWILRGAASPRSRPPRCAWCRPSTPRSIQSGMRRMRRHSPSSSRAELSNSTCSASQVGGTGAMLASSILLRLLGRSPATA